MMVRRTCCLLIGVISWAFGATMAAAAPGTPPGDTAYGRGVQAYFSGDTASAESHFAEAIGADPKDPRPFYFRALCALRQGRSDEARSDFLIAATLEANSRGSFAVGQSLERVQGGDRLVLEQYRWQARPAATATAGSRGPNNTNHHAAIAIHTDAGALRRTVSVPLDRLVQPISLSELAEVSVTDAPAQGSEAQGTAGSLGNPFADDPQSPANGKLRSGKLLGIVGRALLQSAPVPSLEGLREQIPGLPQTAAGDAAPATDVEFGSEPDFGPAQEPIFSDQENPEESANESPPAESVDEDPFG
jgi:hypothetical protein